MKKLILLELTFLFLATTFSSSPPPGWYQQPLPVNDFINDIFFLDSLNGWVATNSDGSPNDTAYVLKTTDGGYHWIIQERNRYYYTRIQFLDYNNGFLCGSTGAALVWKTTNGGSTWFELFNFGLAFAIDDIQFLNQDTGWVSSNDIFFGGIWNTTTGGNSWTKQLSSSTSRGIKGISMVNSDIGWAINTPEGGNKIYRTTNGGMNWDIQYTFPSQSEDVFFFNSLKGIVSSGRFYNTSDGGISWIASQSTETGGKISFANDSIGWAGYNLIYIPKSSNGGLTWFYQLTNVNNPTPFAITSINSWAGGNELIHTIDGGLNNINNINSNILNSFTLYQNFPNPFNPNTIISYQLTAGNYITLKVFDIKGNELITLVNQRQNEGEYKVEFDGSNFISGIYFYRLEILNDKRNEKYTQTKKMFLIK